MITWSLRNFNTTSIPSCHCPRFDGSLNWTYSRPKQATGHNHSRTAPCSWQQFCQDPSRTFYAVFSRKFFIYRLPLHSNAAFHENASVFNIDRCEAELWRQDVGKVLKFPRYTQCNVIHRIPDCTYVLLQTYCPAIIICHGSVADSSLSRYL